MKMTKDVATTIGNVHKLLYQMNTSGDNSKLAVQCMIWLEQISGATILPDNDEQDGTHE